MPSYYIGKRVAIRRVHPITIDMAYPGLADKPRKVVASIDDREYKTTALGLEYTHPEQGEIVAWIYDSDTQEAR